VKEYHYRTKRDVLWERLEEEYGVPVKDLIIDLLFNPYAPLTYSEAAEVLGICKNTLWVWRKVLGIGRRPPVRHPLPEKPVDTKAKAKGYSDIADAIRDLRLNEGMTVEEMSEFLDVSVRSISQYTPGELKGTFNISSTGMEALRESGRRNSARLSRKRHPWRTRKL
jgi:hypothetical protein